MGTTVSVTSVPYNLAGDEDLRPNFLRASIFSSVITESDSIGGDILQNHLNGPGQTLLRFFNYCKRVRLSGLPYATITNDQPLHVLGVQPHIPKAAPTNVVECYRAYVSDGTLIPWLERWILLNHHGRIDEDWTGDFRLTSHDGSLAGTFTLIFPNGDKFLWLNDLAPLYNANERYIIAEYSEYSSTPTQAQRDAARRYIYIYQRGTGNAVLDGWIASVRPIAATFRPNTFGRINFDYISDKQEFFPILPVRLNNISIRDPRWADGLYPETKKAYKKAFGIRANFDELIDKVEDNAHIGDIDYAFVTFGVSLNTKENACRKYIFRFFEELQAIQQDARTNIVQVRGGAGYNYDMRIRWEKIDVEQKNGIHLGGARVGDVRLGTLVGTETYTYEHITRNSEGEEVQTRTGTRNTYTLKIYWQITKTAYREMSITGLTHINHVYDGVGITIPFQDALLDKDESGFILPLHYPTMKVMGLIDYTQMTTACTFIVFNAFTITRRRWYQKGIFKILLIVAAIVITVISGGITAGSAGLLGTAGSVGVALGLAGTAAVIAGAIVNVFAAILLTEILADVTGSKLLGAIVTLAITYGLNPGSFNFDLTSAEDLLKVGDVLANGYGEYVERNLEDIKGEFLSARNNYEQTMESINDLLKEMYNDSGINPLIFIEASRSTNEGVFIPETVDEFINRTTMVGSDIANLTFSMVSNFSETQNYLQGVD